MAMFLFDIFITVNMIIGFGHNYFACMVNIVNTIIIIDRSHSTIVIIGTITVSNNIIDNSIILGVGIGTIIVTVTIIVTMNNTVTN